MHNVNVLVKGKDRCTLLIHPDDARRYGVVDGAPAPGHVGGRLVEVPVEVSDEMMRGVVCLPHGWGHDQPGTRLVGRARSPRGQQQPARPADFVDAISGNAAVNGIPVEVAPTDPRGRSGRRLGAFLA